MSKKKIKNGVDKALRGAPQYASREQKQHQQALSSENKSISQTLLERTLTTFNHTNSKLKIFKSNEIKVTRKQWFKNVHKTFKIWGAGGVAKFLTWI